MNPIKSGKFPKFISCLDSKFLLFIIVIIALSVRLIFFVGFIGSDDVVYAHIVHSIMAGTYGGGIISYRVGLIYPVRFFFSLFGINDYSLALFPLLSSLASIVVVFYLGKLLFTERMGLVAALLLAFFPLDIIYATKLYSDIPVALWTGLSVLFFLMGERGPKEPRSIVYFLSSGLCMGLGYITKLSGVLLILFFLTYVIYKRRIKVSHVYLILGFLVVFISENLVYHLWGSEQLLSRITTVSKSVTTSKIVTPPKLPQSSFLLYPWLMYISFSHFGFYFHFISFAAIYCIIKKVKAAYAPLLWATSLFLYLEFGSWSPFRYVVPQHVPRYLTLISMPVVLVLSAFYAGEKNLLRKKIVLFSLVLLLATSLFFVQLINETDFKIRPILYKQVANYLNEQPKSTVYVPQLYKRVLEYLWGFKGTHVITEYNRHSYTRRADHFPVDLRSVKDAFIIIDHGLIAHQSRLYSVRYPETIMNPPTHWKPVKIIEYSPTERWYSSAKVVVRLLRSGFVPRIIRDRMLATVNTLLEHNKVVIYYVGS